jgi:uncharacterized protein YqgC (DUF456 family)
VGDQIVVALTLLVMIVGLAGVVVPLVPGILVVGLAAVVSTFALGIDASGWLLVATVTLITLGGAGASMALPARRGLRGDAARSSLALAAALGLVGFFVIPVVGMPVGALGGLYLGEINRHGDRARAWVSTRDVLRAYGLGVLVEFGAALLVIAVWLPGTLLRL